MVSSNAISGTVVALLLACGASTPAAAAAPPDGPSEAVVYGQRPDPALQRRVPYGDLDLRGKAGERQLRQRVRVAIARACPASDGALETGHCRSEAWSRARPQIRQAVYNARNMVGFVRLTSMFVTITDSE